MKPERRFKLVMIYDAIIDDIIAGVADRRYLRIPVLKKIRDDAELVGVHHDPRNKQFVICYYHPSWPIIPDYQEIPHWNEENPGYMEVNFDQYVKIAGPEPMDACQKILAKFMELGKPEDPLPF